MSAIATAVDPLIAMRGITKSFGRNRVLRAVDFELRRGEVHALLGENGAGKSTLMKILLGVYAPDEGSVEISGRTPTGDSTRSRLDAGVAMIFQELSLVPTMTVAQNIFLGREIRRRGWRVDAAAQRRAARALIEAHGFDVDPDAVVGDMPFAPRQMVEILKALSRGAAALVMDEPTSSLTIREEERLYQVISGLKQRGIGVVYISHRMAEIGRVADRLSLIKDGVMNGPFAIGEVSIGDVARMMARQPQNAAPARAAERPRQAGAVLLSVAGLSTGRKLNGLSFDLCAGEIVGLAGLVGSGRSTVLKALFGLLPDARGTVIVAGTDISRRPPSGRVGAGLALVPEDRRKEGLVVDHSLGTNVGLPNLADLAERLLPGVVSRRRERDLFLTFKEALAIVCRDDRQPAAELSGGNQQKVVFAKWLATKPKVLLLDEPTAGVDVNAKAEMRALVRQAAERKIAVLLVSSELDELVNLADRLLVMADGAIAASLDHAAGEEEIRKLLQASFDGQQEKAA